MGIGTPRKAFNVIAYNDQKRERQERQLSQVVCEWDQPPGSCRCAGLAADDPGRCKSPIGVARAVLSKFTIIPKAE